MDAAGNIYGTTFNFAGELPNQRILWHGVQTLAGIKRRADAERYLHTFVAGATDGAFPFGVSLDAAGNLYGVAILIETLPDSHCGEDGCGVVFELSPSAGGSWTETILHEFQDGAHGNPNWACGRRCGCVRECFWYGGGRRKQSNGLPGPNGCGIVFEITK